MTDATYPCAYCGQPSYVHIGMCPRVKSITTHLDGSQTVELRGVMDVVRPPDELKEILAVLRLIEQRIRAPTSSSGGRDGKTYSVPTGQR
jgi:hypothetical protein